MKPFRLKPPPPPSEHQEQVALIRWARMRAATLPQLELLFAIANGGERHQIVAAKLKAEGVKPGAPDLCLPVARGGFHGLYLELKRRGGGRLSPEQKIWLERLQEQGYRATVAYGWDDARQIIESYLGAANSGIQG